MLEYQGCKCHFCEKPFEESDDIVVCPECGTPYHRSCYLEAGHCTNTELHESGESWQMQRKKELHAARAEEKRAEIEELEAARERGELPKMFNATLYDGVRLNPNDPTVGLDPDEEYDGIKLGEIAEFVAVNRFYYLPLFRLMKQTGRKISFNFISLLFPQFYFANRKMWLGMIFSVILKTLIGLPNAIVLITERMGSRIAWLDTESAGFMNLLRISAVADLAVSVLFFLFANYLYYRHAVRKISKLRAHSATEAEYLHGLKTEGGSNMWNVALAMLIQTALAGTIYSVLMAF
ncbi:MAG: DUF2628 domain-containing protein [Oscillospiraceae bacterium]|nr:DUF2628 domain-containing protein [Oscillospiraceae bacterium]